MHLFSILLHSSKLQENYSQRCVESELQALGGCHLRKNLHTYQLLSQDITLPNWDKGWNKRLKRRGKLVDAFLSLFRPDLRTLGSPNWVKRRNHRRSGPKKSIKSSRSNVIEWDGALKVSLRTLRLIEVRVAAQYSVTGRWLAKLKWQILRMR